MIRPRLPRLILQHALQLRVQKDGPMRRCVLVARGAHGQAAAALRAISSAMIVGPQVVVPILI